MTALETAALALLARLDHLTTDEFARGGERAERRALAVALGLDPDDSLPEPSTPAYGYPAGHRDDGDYSCAFGCILEAASPVAVADHYRREHGVTLDDGMADYDDHAQPSRRHGPRCNAEHGCECGLDLLDP